MLRFGRRDNPHMLAVGVTGVNMGDRLLQIGCADGGRLAALAAKVGLSGRAVAIVPDEAAAARARKGAARAGVLIEIETAPPTTISADAAAFDLAVIDDTDGFFGGLAADDRSRVIAELLRVLRPGGRVMVVGAAPRTGLGALLARGPSAPQFDPAPALQAGGFKSVRRLAEREGLIFVEGMKPRSS